MKMLGHREYEQASCTIRMIADLPMSLRDSVRLVHDLYTTPGKTGQGEGTKLLKSVCEEADSLGITLILMPDNDKLEAWYNKHGFTRTQDNPVIMARECVLTKD